MKQVIVLSSQMKIPFSIMLLTSIFWISGASTASNFDYQSKMSSMQGEFKKYKKSLIDDFNASKKEFAEYLKQVKGEIEGYKASLSKNWDDPEVISKTKWIEFSDDQKSRSEVDFENNFITIQTIANSSEEASDKLEKVLRRVVTVDTNEYRSTNALEKKIQDINDEVMSSSSRDKSKSEDILADIVFDKAPDVNQVNLYVKKHVSNQKIIETPAKIKGENTYTIKIPLPEDTAIKKAKKYISKVKEQGYQQNISTSLILGIIQTESYFNPLARSHVPAFGLMQIVPETAGVDAHQHLFGNKKVVSADYLYDSDRNIKMGAAYLHVLYYKYFREVKDPMSRLYCSIAAYNTGAGNVSWVFNRGKGFKHQLSVVNALPAINSLTSDEVYDELVNNLKYEEARNYLKKVIDRTSKFSALKM